MTTSKQGCGRTWCLNHGCEQGEGCPHQGFPGAVVRGAEDGLIDVPPWVRNLPVIPLPRGVPFVQVHRRGDDPQGRKPAGVTDYTCHVTTDPLEGRDLGYRFRDTAMVAPSEAMWKVVDLHEPQGVAFALFRLHNWVPKDWHPLNAARRVGTWIAKWAGGTLAEADLIDIAVALRFQEGERIVKERTAAAARETDSR